MPELIFQKSRQVGMTNLLERLRADFEGSVIPEPWWMKLHDKARETHRSMDMQIVLATGPDIEAIKKRKHACSSKA